jgi:hypothetical protein
LVKFNHTIKNWGKSIKPKATVHQALRELFRIELVGLVDAGHALVKMGRQMNGSGFDEQLG